MRRRRLTSSSSGTSMWKGRIVLSSAAAPSSTGSGAGSGPDVVFSAVVFSVIALPLIRAGVQTDRAVRRREGHRRLLGLRGLRDREGTRHAGRVSEPEETVRLG